MFILPPLHLKKVLVIKAHVYEANMHSFVADLFLSFLFEFLLKDQVL